MVTTINQERASITATGAIALPTRLRQRANLKPGDELLVVWLPPDTFILRKWSEIIADDELFAAAMREFDQTLNANGYHTDDDVLNLIREVKQEQYAEWTKG